MDFTLSPEIEDLRLRVRAFVEEHVLPLEADPANFAEHENIPHERLEPVRASTFMLPSSGAMQLIASGPKSERAASS